MAISGGGGWSKGFRGIDQVIFINMLNLKCLLDILIEMLKRQLNGIVWNSGGKVQPGDNKLQNEQQWRWPSKPWEKRECEAKSIGHY